MSTDRYLDRIGRYHRSRPRFRTMVDKTLQPLDQLQTAIRSFPQDYDLDTAVGAQLDAIGEWVGVSRGIVTPLENIWFSFDLAGQGFDEADWLGPYDSETGLTTLNDTVYRLLLRARIALNSWDGTVPAAQAVLDIFFTDPESRIFYDDRGDMTASIGISGKIPTVLLLIILSGGYLPLKPGGVDVDYQVTTVNNTACFGFDTDNEFIGGFDSGAWAQPTSNVTTL